MKKINSIVFIAALTFGSILAASCTFGKLNVFSDSDGIKGSGNIKTETRNLIGFKAIEAGNAFNLEIDAQSSFGVTVEADDNLIEHVKTELSGDTLKIYNEGNISSQSPIKIKISMPKIDEADISGASDATIINVSNEFLKLNVSGASKIKISGESKNLDLKASGASRIDAEQLTVDNANVNASGASNAVVSASNEVKAQASGASKIRYTGEPNKVDRNSSGASSIEAK